MRVQLAQQAKEILGTSDVVMITERVDDVALLIGQMVKMGLPEVLDRLSSSRLNHGQPGVQAHPEIVQGATELHDEIADALLPQADPVFHDATPLDVE